MKKIKSYLPFLTAMAFMAICATVRADDSNVTTATGAADSVNTAFGTVFTTAVSIGVAGLVWGIVRKTMKRT